MKGELRVLTAEPLGGSVIERLEEALARAREGSVSSIAIAIVNRDGSSESCWSDVPSYGLLIGAVARMQYRLMIKGDEA